ncbi:MAG: NAD(P)/FAD-dependent oxidoreductase [Myxococcota bacterium]|jgi:phytoene dehydrogenase-like protein|nr:NAD(P)/FAD-dependent oxidoreductase [Myxococcota bacterium]
MADYADPRRVREEGEERSMSRASDLRTLDAETDVVVIGSGIGGLTCAALLAKNGLAVTVCESHVTPGGAAHGFERDGFHFESGPSFFTGLSAENSANPMSMVLAQLDERVESVAYDRWHFHFPEGLFVTGSNEERFHRELARFVSPEAMKEWLRFEEVMKQPLAPDQTHQPFSSVVDEMLSDSFLRRLCDFDAFSLSGMDAGGTPLAEMNFMFKERFQSTVDYPIGGSQAIVDALVRGLEKNGGVLLLGAHVDEVIVEEGRAAGVKLRRGGSLRTRRAVVSNATVWDTQDLFPPGALPAAWCEASAQAPQCESILHLHLGIDASGLPEDLPIHHVVLNSWDVTAPQNMCNISIPSTLDPSLAPKGHHVVHAYTAGNEPYEVWQGLHHKSDAYIALKNERAEVLWRAMEKIIPDVRERARLALIGTPLTHERFLRRKRGTYGAAYRADLGQAFPGPATPLDGFYCCGDSNMPGVGVPAVAVSGMMTAGAAGA